jgi:hypothetical protein
VATPTAQAAANISVCRDSFSNLPWPHKNMRNHWNIDIVGAVRISVLNIEPIKEEYPWKTLKDEF